MLKIILLGWIAGIAIMGFHLDFIELTRVDLVGYCNPDL